MKGTRDLRIDWLRGLAMTCVIIDHSKLSSLLSWFSYQRLWLVTAAEVFVVLSGVVLGTVYGQKLARSGWPSVVGGLGRRALTLYVAFLAVTLSILVLSLTGIHVGSITTFDDRSAAWFLDPRTMTAAAWRDVALMRAGPWAFEIVGLYVWLVAAAVPCLAALQFAGWRPLLAVSWILYIHYRIAPHALTTAEFESVFPILAWQLLFVHGIVIGYHREHIGAFVARCPRGLPAAAAVLSTAFAVLALCNPQERFTDLYAQYFTLADLGIGRLLNLAVALPLGYGVLTRCWSIARPVATLFVTLGQQSLGAFVLHVYGILLLAHMPGGGDYWSNGLVQVMLVAGIAGMLYGVQRLPLGRRAMRRVPARPLPA